MSNGTVVSLEFSLLSESSFLVGTVLRVLHDILSEEAFASLLQEVIGQLKKKPTAAGSFEHLGDLILAYTSG
jgi:hypothetical protein